MKDEIQLLDLNSLTLDTTLKYFEQRRERLKKPSAQDQFLKMISEYVYAVDMGMDTDELRQRHEKLVEFDNIHKSIIDLVDTLKPKKKEAKPRIEVITKERCQTVAKILWRSHPDMTIVDVACHELIYNLDITGGKNFDLRTVRDWVAEVFPKGKKKQVGRPRKKQK